jgi:hypothetical protein
MSTRHTDDGRIKRVAFFQIVATVISTGEPCVVTAAPAPILSSMQVAR